MSFDLYVQRFQNGGIATFPRSIFDDIFSPGVINPDFPLMQVEYEDGSHIEIYGNDAEDLDGLMFTHFSGEIVFARIFELADRTGSVIYWPDTAPALAVTNPAVIAHIPGIASRQSAPRSSQATTGHWPITSLDRAALPKHWGRC
jgi:hypothetical protein